MATLRSLIQGDLPPTGNPVQRRVVSGARPAFDDYQPIWLQSGTAALSLALIAARETAAHISQPEVIVPGYGCPDLVAAAVYAGLQPVLVDICPDFHGYDLGRLSAALSANTVAIIAVNFLGIPERLSQIRNLIKSRPAIALIEDNAQWFPEPADKPGLQGDYVCLSFGRGKPVSLLGGGCLLVRKSSQFESLLNKPNQGSNPPRLSLQLKYFLYNQLLKPVSYQFLSRNPWLKLGETHYKALSGLETMDRHRRALLTANIEAHQHRNPWQQQAIADTIADSKQQGLIDLSATSSASGRLLRYPLLCKTQTLRDNLLESLNAEGLGSSAMYQKPLTTIAAVAEKVSYKGELPGAADFAQRLITLPTHEGVRTTDLQRLARILNQQ